ncbi:T-complex protein 1 subunit theta [Olea europaea subsp. europaea]|uniref:T-complex protein 1 subunit theta n=1 Tax=Olea europaea subsp. europaea TaxID=158383 RepID=A0A8S0UBA0_OLEEU|nr:T-complex protein 1 subunit theta [Olea europaea subsp. europaea]
MKEIDGIRVTVIKNDQGGNPVSTIVLRGSTNNDLGYIDSILVKEIGGIRVTVVKNDQGGNPIFTIVMQGNTDSVLDDLERAVDDGVNTYKAMCRDSRIILGAATTEIELARRLKEFSFKETWCLQGCVYNEYMDLYITIL